MDYFISRCTRSERRITRSLSLSLSYIALRSTLPPVHNVVPWRDPKKRIGVSRLLAANPVSRPRSNPVRRSCQTLFSESNQRLSVKKILLSIYLHDIIS